MTDPNLPDGTIYLKGVRLKAGPQTTDPNLPDGNIYLKGVR